MSALLMKTLVLSSTFVLAFAHISTEGPNGLQEVKKNDLQQLARTGGTDESPHDPV